MDDMGGVDAVALGITVRAAGDAVAVQGRLGAFACSKLDIANRPVSACPHCSGGRMQRWGVGRTNVQRWRCRDCLRSCSSSSGTLLARVHAPEKLERLVGDMLSPHPSTCRQLAADLRISVMTAWAWRQKVSRAFVALAESPTSGWLKPPQSDQASATVILRESRKASREWVDHRRAPKIYPAPNRLRWIDYRLHHLPLPSPMTPFLVTVRLVIDATGDASAKLLGALGMASAVLTLKVTASPAPHGHVEPTSVQSILAAAPQGGSEGSRNPCADQSANALAHFLRLCRGPATRHLAGYVAWFLTRLATPDEDRQRAMRVAVCARLAA